MLEQQGRRSRPTPNGAGTAEFYFSSATRSLPPSCVSIAFASGESGLSLTTLRTSSSARVAVARLALEAASSSFESTLGSTGDPVPRSARGFTQAWSSSAAGLASSCKTFGSVGTRLAAWRSTAALVLVALRREPARFGDRVLAEALLSVCAGVASAAFFCRRAIRDRGIVLDLTIVARCGGCSRCWGIHRGGRVHCAGPLGRHSPRRRPQRALRARPLASPVDLGHARNLCGAPHGCAPQRELAAHAPPFKTGARVASACL